jgi:hypothetical protein
MNNRPLIISIGVNILLLLLLAVSIAVGVKACYRQCPPASDTTVINYRDSIIPVKDTTAHTILSGTPKLIKSVPASLSSPAPLSVAAVEACTDTNYYCHDTSVADGYKANVSAVVTGNHLIQLDVKYVSFKPEVIRIKEVTRTIVEQPKSAMFKVYGGAFGMIGQQPGQWGIGVKADVVINDGYMIGYGFDVKNQTHQIEVLMKIKFRK